MVKLWSIDGAPADSVELVNVLEAVLLYDEPHRRQPFTTYAVKRQFHQSLE